MLSYKARPNAKQLRSLTNKGRGHQCVNLLLPYLQFTCACIPPLQCFHPVPPACAPQAEVQGHLRRIREHHVLTVLLRNKLSIPARGRANQAFRMTYLLETFMLSVLLRDDQQLKDALRQAAHILLPSSLARAWSQRLQSREIRVPNKDVLSKRRFCVDSAFTMVQRSWLQTLCQQPIAVFMLVDSAPQGGRDYELILLHVASIQTCCSIWQDLRHFFARPCRDTHGGERARGIRSDNSGQCQR